MAKKQEKKAYPTFVAKVDGVEREYAFTYPKLNIPGRGVMTAEEILQDREVLAGLIKQGGGEMFVLLGEKKPAAKSTTKKSSK